MDRPLNRVYQIIYVVAMWVLVLVTLLSVATITATRRSQERTECYRAKQSIEACPKPAAWENWLKAISL